MLSGTLRYGPFCFCVVAHIFPRFVAADGLTVVGVSKTVKLTPRSLIL